MMRVRGLLGADQARLRATNLRCSLLRWRTVLVMGNLQSLWLPATVAGGPAVPTSGTTPWLSAGTTIMQTLGAATRGKIARPSGKLGFKGSFHGAGVIRG